VKTKPPAPSVSIVLEPDHEFGVDGETGTARLIAERDVEGVELKLVATDGVRNATVPLVKLPWPTYRRLVRWVGGVSGR
jgi:hypothetical protein